MAPTDEPIPYYLTGPGRRAADGRPPLRIVYAEREPCPVCGETFGREHHCPGRPEPLRGAELAAAAEAARQAVRDALAAAADPEWWRRDAAELEDELTARLPIFYEGVHVESDTAGEGEAVNADTGEVTNPGEPLPTIDDETPDPDGTQ